MNYVLSMMTRIDLCDDLQVESCGWLFESALAGGGGIFWQLHHRPHRNDWQVEAVLGLRQSLCVWWFVISRSVKEFVSK